MSMVTGTRIILAILVVVMQCVSLRISHSTANTLITNARRYGSMGGEKWSEFKGFECEVLGPIAVLNHLGDYNTPTVDDYDSKEKLEFQMNCGKAMDTLRRHLPMVFVSADLDFSIFANSITVTDTKQNKFQMQKSLYMGAVKSLRMASAFSSIYPAMNVRKIEYIEECQAIHCLVDVVLPDSIKVEGQAAWEGSFFFGLDSAGLINAHTFDRKVTNLRPNPLLTSSYPWLKGAASWGEEFVNPAPQKRRLVTSYCETAADQQ